MLVELTITGVILIPAVWMAITRSSRLIEYAIIVVAFNRGLRRVVDYYVNEQFNPRSLISLTPLLVGMLLLIPAFQHRHRLGAAGQRVLMLLGAAIGLGLLIGLVINRLAAVYSLAEWLAAIAAIAFTATQPASQREADRWIKTAGWAAIGVALYGWWQYYTIPPWDAMWLEQSGMQGYMGQPIPTQMTLFSTMNERGPCAALLAWAAIPMVLSRRWRNFTGWVAVALLVATIFLTGTRTMFVVMAIVCVMYPLLTKGKGVVSILLFTVGAVFALDFLIAKIPGTERFAERYSADSLHGESSSLRGRLEIYQSGAFMILRNPLGFGLGSSGMGKRVESDSVEGVGDSGYIQIFAQFGWLGGLLFFGALWKIWRELGERWEVGAKMMGHRRVDGTIPAARAILIASLALLLVNDFYAGFSIIWIFFGRALAIDNDPRLQAPPLAAQGAASVIRRNAAHRVSGRREKANGHRVHAWRRPI